MIVSRQIFPHHLGTVKQYFHTKKQTKPESRQSKSGSSNSMLRHRPLIFGLKLNYTSCFAAPIMHFTSSAMKLNNTEQTGNVCNDTELHVKHRRRLKMSRSYLARICHVREWHEAPIRAQATFRDDINLRWYLSIAYARVMICSAGIQHVPENWPSSIGYRNLVPQHVTGSFELTWAKLVDRTLAPLKYFNSLKYDYLWRRCL